MNKAISQIQKTSSHAEAKTSGNANKNIKNIIKVFLLKLH